MEVVHEAAKKICLHWYGRNGKETTLIGSDLSQTHTTVYGVVLTALFVEAETSQKWC